MSRSAVVSIHDVSPLTRDATERMLGELAAHGIPRTSLLVIPDHHRRGHFLDDPAFCEWLKGKVRDGHEAVIHGYHHQRARRAGESLGDRLTTRFYTADEGEFYDIDEETALELVRRAQGDFAKLDLAPTGFVAPAWLLSEAGERALKRAGIGYTTRLGSVLDLASGERHDSQSMVFSVRSAWRRVTSLGWNSWLYQRLAANQLLRIGVHPPDLGHPAVWRHILRHCALAARNRKISTYAQWIEEARQRPHAASIPNNSRNQSHL